MASFTSLLTTSSLVALASAHGVITMAQGLRGSPPSVAFGVDPNIPRDCASIQPCQQDTSIIRDSEINQNLVNKCGRTQLKGNIDIGQNTENYIRNGTITKVRRGGVVAVNLHQVNADGAGPYKCDIDQSSNGGTFTNLVVRNNVPGSNGLSQGLAKDFVMSVMLPRNLRCTGGSTGNICTIRCRNSAVAGPFGGCFPIQQVDVRPNRFTPDNIQTANNAQDIAAQEKTGSASLNTAIQANNRVASKDPQAQSVSILNALLPKDGTTTA